MRREHCAALVILCSVVACATALAGPKWQRLDDGDPPPPFADIVYRDANSLRIRTVLGLGSDNGNPDFARPPTMWELQGEDWHRVAFPEPSPSRVRACSSYDTTRKVLVVFGNPSSDETWEYDGSVWTQKNPATRPPTRSFCAMAFDENRNKTVMMGGYNANGIPLPGTWEWDGVNWVLRSLMVNPAARSRHAMTYDPDRHVVLLFGGQQGLASTFYNDTWEFNGTSWTKRNTPTAPAARASLALAYDRARHRGVVFGGFNSVQPLGDTWEWNGNQWTAVTPAVSPPPGWNVQMAFDPAKSAIVAQGEEFDQGGSNDTWSYNGITWTKIALSTLPMGRRDFGLAYDPLIDRIVLHGGKNIFRTPVREIADTWLLDGSTWAQDTASLQPSSAEGFVLTYDPAHDHLVGFGGDSSTSPFVTGDTHTYGGDPRMWSSQFDCCPSPPPRTDSRLTNAQALGGNVLFGGWACCFGTSLFAADDTWRLDGATWIEQFPSTAPRARLLHGLAYDSVRNRVVLYGGLWTAALGAELADMWIYDGTDWTELSAISAPGYRYGVGFVYDSARDRMVLFGDGEFTEKVTWEFDGSNWQAIPTPFLPDPDRCNLQMAYDSKREVTWLFGGTACDSDLYFNDTWAYGPDPDDDGIVGKLDNCIQLANVNQANADGDVAGDACDCAPTDGGSFGVPVESSGLLVNGGAASLVSWTDQVPSLGTATTYDLVSGTLAVLRSAGSYSGSICLSSGSGTPSFTDPRAPAVGDGFWYLVRARNACGSGTFGRPGLNAASPCP